LGGEPDLLLESFGAEGRCQIGPQYLQGDATAVPEVACEIDRSHPAASKLALDRIGRPDDRLQVPREIRHDAFYLHL
jgi:hypothetical protein